MEQLTHLKMKKITYHLKIYKMNDKYYKRYNTYQKIITNEDYDGSRARGAPPLPAPVVNINKRKVI